MDEHEDTRAITRVSERMYDIAKSKGFHDGETEDNFTSRFGSWCANLHGEVSELWEAYRNHALYSNCDKVFLPGEQLACAEEELADIVIRAMDTAVAMGLDIGRAIEIKARYNQTRAHRHGGKAG